MKELKCKSCGAPLNASTMKCEYCGTSYLKEDSVGSPGMDTVKFDGILTPNEVRQVMGLEPVPDNAPVRLWNYINKSINKPSITKEIENIKKLQKYGIEGESGFLSVDGSYEPKI